MHCVREFTEPLQVELKSVASRDRRVLVYRPGQPRQLFMILHVVDPNGAFLGLKDRRFGVALGDSSNLYRMLFLHQQLRLRNQDIKVSVDGFNTEITYLDREGYQSQSGVTDVYLHFDGNHLAEEPSLALVGAVSQLVFNELRRKFPGTIEPFILNEIAHWREMHADTASDDELIEEFYELLRLRTAWHLTTQFYLNNTPATGERRPASFFQERYGSGIWAPSFEFFETVRLLTARGHWSEREAFLRGEFEEFYDVDAEKVELLWPMPLPERWEFSLAAPPISQE